MLEKGIEHPNHYFWEYDAGSIPGKIMINLTWNLKDPFINLVYGCFNWVMNQIFT